MPQEVDFLGEPCRGLWTKDDPDRALRIAVDIPIAQLLARYESACARSREIAMSFDLDTASKKEVQGQPFTLRYVPPPELALGSSEREARTVFVDHERGDAAGAGGRHRLPARSMA